MSYKGVFNSIIHASSGERASSGVGWRSSEGVRAIALAVEASLAAMFEMPRFRCVFAGESEQNSVCSFASVDLTVVRT